MKPMLFRTLGLVMLFLGFARERNEQRIAAVKARMRLRVRWMIAGVIVFAVVAGVVGALAVVSGVGSIKASAGHWAITEWFLHFSMKRSVALHAADIEPPPREVLEDPRMVLIGAGHYETGCRFCHGIPGEKQPRVTHAMTPHPPALAPVVGEWDDAGLYYLVLHGVKFTGMPAWPAQQREDEVWPMVAFLRRLPQLDEQGYQDLVFGDQPVVPDAPELVNDVCARCHGADGLGRGGAFPKLAGQRPEYLRRSLLAFRRGDRHSGIMQPIAGLLDDREIDALAAWYASRPPGPRNAGKGSARGEEIALHGIPSRRLPACSECHGPGARPRHPAFPILAGQYAPYLEQQLTLFEKGHRGGTEFVGIMQTVADHWLKAEDIAEVAAYYASLPAETAASE